MSKQQELSVCIRRIQKRLRLEAWLRGVAALTGSALILTTCLVYVLNQFAFPARGVSGARMALLSAIAAAAAFGIVLPLMRLTRGKAVQRIESANRELEQRLTTFYDKEGKGGDPFVELLAADTLKFTQYIEPSSMVPDARVFALAGAGAACAGVLVWMIAAGPGYMGYGATLLWTGITKAHVPYFLAVSPGNIAVRRNSDQLIAARVTGIDPAKVQLHARYQSAKRWESVTMQAATEPGGAASYQFVLAGLPEDVEYYVAAGPLESPHYAVRVVDLPSVKQVRVTYHYPKWTGMKAVTEERSGDLRAIEGTDAAIELEMDHPLKDGQLLLDDGKAIQLIQGEGNKYRGTVHMEKDGAYHVAAMDESQPVRLSEDYFIATDKAQPPEISIDRPRGDYRANPIEEVTVGMKAEAQFGLKDVHLHYSVNGGPEREVSMLNGAGAKAVDGSHLLALEDYKLVPGDLVSLYATARDGHAEARTDMSFIQVEPFEREFSQSQQSGGGGSGGGQNNQTDISKREKELIAATWKQENNKGATQKDAAAAGQFLSDAQEKLREQVNALSARIESRDLSAATEEFSGFNKDMQEAAKAMAPSADKLKVSQWKDAIPLEQKALQALLHAEATFRQIQVAFGQQGGGSGGGGNSGRDLASLFDLELDTEKNQYETAQATSPEEHRAKEVEDALAKLDALAKRQEEQANQQDNPEQKFQQRWQQEMLRREAEDLRRQLKELAKNQQGQESSAANDSAAAGGNGERQRDSLRHGSTGRDGSQSADQNAANDNDPRVAEALRRVQQAADAMKRSTDSQQGRDAAREAANQLHEATNLLGGMQGQLASGRIDSMAREAGRISEAERAQADRINKLANQPANGVAGDLTDTMARIRERNALAQERQQLSNDLSKLGKSVREGAREMAPNQPQAAKQLRDALTEMDNADLDNHMQRTADWLRRGVNPNSNGTEGEIAQGLENLKEQLRRAQKSMSEGRDGSRGGNNADRTAALDTIERLRSRVESMGRAGRSGEGQDPKQGARGNQGAGSGVGSQTGGRQGQAGGEGQVGRGDIGDVQYGGGRGGDGTAWGNVNTGNNRYRQPGQRGNPQDEAGDQDRAYQQGLQELSQVQRTMKGDPEVAKAAEELARQMRRLDSSRFPGNPEMVEQMHREVLSSIDRLELEVERRLTGSIASRSGKTETVPQGYENSVAAYYRQLSKLH